MAKKRTAIEAGIVKLPAKKKTRIKRSEKRKTIDAYKGKLLKDCCSTAATVNLLKDRSLETWGLVVQNRKELHLCTTAFGKTAEVSNANIIGVLFIRNYGHSDLVETLALLFHRKEGDRLCLLLDKKQYEHFSQDEADALMELCDGFPEAPEPTTCPDLESHIIAILKWCNVDYVPHFRIGSKIEVEKSIRSASFDATQIPAVLNEDNSRDVFDMIKSTFVVNNIFCNKRFNIDISRCYLAPAEMKYREWNPEYSKELKASFYSRSALNFQKKVCFLFPIKFDHGKKSERDSYMGDAFRSRPSLADMATCDFWIIGGQHTIFAYKLLLEDDRVDKDLKEVCKFVEVVVFWSEPTIAGKVKMVDLSVALNKESDTEMKTSAFLSMARQVRNIYISWGRPSAQTSSRTINTYKVCKKIIEWARDKTASKAESATESVNFKELRPFIFRMKDACFEKWMQVHEMSLSGELIAFNGCEQKKVIRKKKRDAWALAARALRPLAGLDHDVLVKIADKLINKRDICLQDFKENHPTFRSDMRSEWTTLTDYCYKKKIKTVFQVLMLCTLGGEKKKDVLPLLRKERKAKYKALIHRFKVGSALEQKMKFDLVMHARTLGGKPGQPTVDFSTIAKSLPPAFSSLLSAIQSQEVNNSCPRRSLSGRMLLKSTEGSLQSLIASISNDAAMKKSFKMIFIDTTLTTSFQHMTETDFHSFFKMLKSVGSDPAHVVVFIADPMLAAFLERGLMVVGEYISLSSEYAVALPKEKSIPCLLNFRLGKKVFKVVYAFYKKGLDLSPGTEKIEKDICTTFLKHHSFGSYNETDEDVSARMMPSDKSKAFFEGICWPFLVEEDHVLWVGDGIALPSVVLGRNCKLVFFCSKEIHDTVWGILSTSLGADVQPQEDDEMRVEVNTWVKKCAPTLDIACVKMLIVAKAKSLQISGTELTSLLEAYNCNVENAADIPYVIPDPLPSGPMAPIPLRANVFEDEDSKDYEMAVDDGSDEEYVGNNKEVANDVLGGEGCDDDTEEDDSDDDAVEEVHALVDSRKKDAEMEKGSATESDPDESENVARPCTRVFAGYDAHGFDLFQDGADDSDAPQDELKTNKDIKDAFGCGEDEILPADIMGGASRDDTMDEANVEDEAFKERLDSVETIETFRKGEEMSGDKDLSTTMSESILINGVAVDVDDPPLHLLCGKFTSSEAQISGDGSTKQEKNIETVQGILDDAVHSFHFSGFDGIHLGVTSGVENVENVDVHSENLQDAAPISEEGPFISSSENMVLGASIPAAHSLGQEQDLLLNPSGVNTDVRGNAVLAPSSPSRETATVSPDRSSHPGIEELNVPGPLPASPLHSETLPENVMCNFSQKNLQFTDPAPNSCAFANAEADRILKRYGKTVDTSSEVQNNSLVSADVVLFQHAPQPLRVLLVEPPADSLPEISPGQMCDETPLEDSMKESAATSLVQLGQELSPEIRPDSPSTLSRANSWALVAVDPVHQAVTTLAPVDIVRNPNNVSHVVEGVSTPIVVSSSAVLMAEGMLMHEKTVPAQARVRSTRGQQKVVIHGTPNTSSNLRKKKNSVAGDTTSPSIPTVSQVIGALTDLPPPMQKVYNVKDKPNVTFGVKPPTKGRGGSNANGLPPELTPHECEVSESGDELTFPPNIREKRILILLELKSIFMTYEVIGNDPCRQDVLGRLPNDGKYCFHVRPDFQVFLQMCFRVFDVAIWTTFTQKFTTVILNSILSEADLKNIKFIFTYSSLQDSGILVGKSKIMLKDMREVWSKFPHLYNASNTLLLDGTFYRAYLNPPDTILCCSSYYHFSICTRDDFLLNYLWPTLEKLASSWDVRLFLSLNQPKWSQYNALLSSRKDSHTFEKLERLWGAEIFLDVVPKYPILLLSKYELSWEIKKIVEDIQGPVESMTDLTIQNLATVLAFDESQDPKEYLERILGIRDTTNRFHVTGLPSSCNRNGSIDPTGEKKTCCNVACSRFDCKRSSY